MRDVRGDDIGMIFQEPMTALNPMLTVGFQVTEALRRHRGMSAAEARTEALRLFDLVRIPDAGAPARRSTRTPFSGGHAPARDDRDGHGLPPEAPDRRRADDRARRHHPGADPLALDDLQKRDRHGGHVHHPRHGRRGRDRRPRGGDAEGRQGGGRAGARGLRRPARALHAHAARLGAPSRRAGRHDDAAALRRPRRGRAGRRAAGAGQARRDDPRRRRPRHALPGSRRTPRAPGRQGARRGERLIPGPGGRDAGAGGRIRAAASPRPAARCCG